MFMIIASISQNRGLGYRGELLYHLKRDMQFFKSTTSGHPVIMGRKTWESLPKKLPNRQNLVVSGHPDSIPPKHPKTTQTGLKTPENGPKTPISATKVTQNPISEPKAHDPTPVMPDEIITNFPQFLEEHKNDPDPYYIIGGAKIYAQALPYAKTLLLTEIADEKPADTFFPDFDPKSYVKTLIEKGSENGLDFTINRYDKI